MSDFKLYFAKINLVSHISEVYKDNNVMNQILAKVILNFKNDLQYERIDTKIKDNKEIETYRATYRLDNIEKLDGKYGFSIIGKMYKDSYIYIQRQDKNTEALYKTPVDNTEVIFFYYDVYREMVMFNITHRFRQGEFPIAFKEILNSSVKEYGYIFDVELFKKSISLDDIKEELRKIGRIEQIKIDIKLPNPDSNLLKKISEDPEEKIERFRKARLSSKSIILTSTTEEGINIDSELVDKELQEVSSIHSQISSEDAIKNGYASVEAEGANNMRYTTKDSKSVTMDIEEFNRNLEYFKENGNKFIISVIR